MTDEENDPKYPHVEVQLTGEDGNAYDIMGRVQHAMRRAGIDRMEMKAYVEEATSGDYDNLLRVTMKWVTVR